MDLPPNRAPMQFDIVPNYRSNEQRDRLLEYAQTIMDELKEAGVSVKLDRRENVKPGWKFAEYEAQGIPLRIAVGPRDLENNNVELARRDTLEKNLIYKIGRAHV